MKIYVESNGKENERVLYVSGFNYIIHSNGQIFSTIRGKEIKQRFNQDGYKEVTLGGTNSRSSYRVHRLVALAFVHNDNPEEKTEVNHIDFNRINNDFRNLEWVTHLENIDHSYKHGRYKIRDFSNDKNPNYGNTKLKEFYKLNPDIALQNNSRPGAQNGRCRKIKLLKNNVVIKEFDYIGQCCEFLIEEYGFKTKVDNIRSQINRVMKSNKEYKGFSFEFIEDDFNDKKVC